MIGLKITVKYPFLPKVRSISTGLVMDTFGIQFDQGEHVIADDLALDVRSHDIVLFTGPSGSGKSSLLRAVKGELLAQEHQLIDIDQLILPERPLVDALPLPMQEAMNLLSACGLSEAQLLLRTPQELSDGQRYRFRLALALAALQKARSASQSPVSPAWLVADEFTATLDRTLAQVLSYNLSRLVRQRQVGLLLATTHEDIVSDLSTDVWVRPNLDGQIGVEYAD